MSLDLDLDQLSERVAALCDDDDTLLAVVRTGETKAAVYALGIVEREHPNEPGATILMERYAQLAAEWSDMSDTWMKNGINRRTDGSGNVARSLAQAYASIAAQQDAETTGERDPLSMDAENQG